MLVQMKLSIFQSYLQKEKIDLAVLFHPDSNITYFTQMKPSSALLVIKPKEAIFYLSLLDKWPQLKGIHVQKLTRQWEKELSNKKVKTVGVNKSSLSLESFEKLQKIYPSAKFVDIGEEVVRLRELKTPQEIEYTTMACKITSDAFTALIKELQAKQLKTEQDVAFFLERFIKSKGAELAFPTIVASGKNSSIPHHPTSNTELVPGFLQLDFGAQWKNYCADMSRVLYLGQPTEQEKKMYYKLLGVQERTIQQATEGVPFKKLDEFSRRLLGKEAKYFVHGLGHGVGIDIHEHPVYGKKNARLQKSQVFTIEPGIYFPNKYGLRIEDTLVFDGQARILTTVSKNLIIIDTYK